MQARKKNTVAHHLCGKSQRKALYQVWTSKIPSMELVLKYGFPFLHRPFYTSSWMWWNFLKDMPTGSFQGVSFFSMCVCCCIILVSLKNTRCLHWCPSPGKFLVAAPSSLGALQCGASTLPECWNPRWASRALQLGGVESKLPIMWLNIPIINNHRFQPTCCKQKTLTRALMPTCYVSCSPSSTSAFSRH